MGVNVQCNRGDLPSCLQPNISWAVEEITSVTLDVDSPELCQDICQADPACVAITWTQDSFPLYPLSCATFSSTDNVIECVDCVSGPAVCSCSVPGECETSEENVLQILSAITSENDCMKACDDYNLCTNYTYLGPQNPLRFVCFLLSSCGDVFTGCQDCHAGIPDCQICDYGDFVDGQCLTTTTAAPETTTTAIAEDIGILVIGGDPYPSKSVEFWSPSDPEEGSCQLNDYPRVMYDGPTANLVSGQLVACALDSCEIYNGGGEWSHLVDTISRRYYHSSAVKENRILLIGGQNSRSTEWISLDGSPSQPGPFDVRHGWDHCSAQISEDLIVVSGGDYTSELVTLYQLTGDVDETPLTSMNRGRRGHACGVYRDAGGKQVLLISGGWDDSFNIFSSTEVAVLSSGSQLEWREVEGGQLPSPRFRLRATSIGDIIYVSGGWDDNDNDLTSILSWDPVAESWQPAGDLDVARDSHAAVAVPTSFF